MHLYYTSGKCASYIRKDVFAHPLHIEQLYIPKELVTHEFIGMFIMCNPPWLLRVLEPGEKAPHTCFMMLNSSDEVDKYK